MSASSLPPRTPYTPFTSHLPSKQNFIYNPSSSGGRSPYAHLLEDTDDPLAKLYRQILRFLERDLTRIMDIAERVSVKSTSRFSLAKEDHIESPILDDVPAERKGFEIMANVIWGEIGHAIMNELGSIVFSVGRPDDFRRVRFQSWEHNAD
jgi:conserved oligomeric Golgi complex subunit 2